MKYTTDLGSFTLGGINKELVHTAKQITSQSSIYDLINLCFLMVP